MSSGIPFRCWWEHEENMAKREYTKDGLTVLWDSEKCEHCESCWRGLPSVFDPQARPWVNMGGATTGEIRKQVEQCPPQALSVKDSHNAA